MIILYTLLIGIVAFTAILIYTTTSIERAIMSFLGTCLGIAALIFVQEASFIAVVQVLIYGGSSLLLLLYSSLLPRQNQPTRWLRHLIIIMLVALIVGPMGWHTAECLLERSLIEANDDAVKVIGMQLMGTYTLAFEWIGMILLVALVGAATIIPPSKRK